MHLNKHTFLAFLSACGFTASGFAYVVSFRGATLGSLLPWSILLGVGVVGLVVPIHFLERPASKHWRFYWNGWARGIPSWAILCVNLLWLVVIANFAWELVRSDFAVPIIRDGQYVLSSRGRIIKVLTQSEYLNLKEGDLRLFAILMINCYFIAMLYWWFRRSDQPAE
jgi:hypothetical protein